MAHELELGTALRLRVERTQVVVVEGKGERRHAQAIPLDMIQSVGFGHTSASLGYIMGAVLAFVAGLVLFWLAPMPFVPWIYAAAGLLIAGLLVGLFFLQAGHALSLQTGSLALRYACRKRDMGEVQRFAREVMTARVDFIEGMYGEEE